MLVYFALILTMLVGFCGLAIDVGRMEVRTNQLQAAADAGALAAAGELAHGGTGSNYQTAANNDIAAYETANGIPTNTTNTTVIGATYGSYINDDGTVQVTVSQSFPTILMGLLSESTVTLSAQSVALMPPCMVFLGSPLYTGTYDASLASSGIQTFTWGCPYYAKDGVSIDGSSNMYGGQIRTAAGPSSTLLSGSTQSTPIYNVPAITDPLAYITAPTPASPCTYPNPTSYLNQSSTATITLNPGTYCGQITASPTYIPGPGTNCGNVGSTTTPAIDIEGTYTGCPQDNSQSTCSSVPTVTFNPGTYIIVGGMNLNCVNANSTGATLFFTKNASVGYGQMRMTSTAWQVNAPNDASSGGTPGIGLMSDRNWVGSAQDFLFTFSTWNADGVLYVTGTGIYESGTPMNAPNYLNMVTSNLYSVGGEIHARINYANLPAGNPLQEVVSLVQ